MSDAIINKDINLIVRVYLLEFLQTKGKERRISYGEFELLSKFEDFLVSKIKKSIGE